MKYIEYSSINTANFIAVFAGIISFSVPIYMGEKFLFSMMISILGLLFARLLTITKCYKISYDKNEVNLINAFLPFVEYRYQLSDIKEIFEVGVMNWGSGINIITHSGKLRTFGTDGSNDQEVSEMIDFINNKLKEGKNKSKSE